MRQVIVICAIIICGCSANTKIPTADESRQADFAGVLFNIEMASKYGFDSYILVSKTLGAEDITKLTDAGYIVTKEKNGYKISWERK